MTEGQAQAMSRAQALAIADAFLPDTRFGNRWHYYYVRSKLLSDPLYGGVCDALRGTQAPVLDLGCGLGLLAHALRQAGSTLPYRGIDNDVRKVELAQRAAARHQLPQTQFDTVDLAAGESTPHRGSVTLLDVLQFIPLDAQQRTLDSAIAMLTPGARLVIRTGLDDGSRRARITRAVDRLSRTIGWMNAGPRSYPVAEQLRERFERADLQSEFTPLFGNTPFNNWRVVATRKA